MAFPAIRGIPEKVYCSLDKIDLTATVEGRPVAMQTDHRTAGEIEAEPELSALFAMARVLNARSHLVEHGVQAPVRYVVAAAAPPVLREALAAVGALLERATDRVVERCGALSLDAVGALADRSFRALALRTAARVGTRDLAIALRMLEDQTAAAPPDRDDEPAYWRRVLELAALAGELLRAKYAGTWVHTERALVPFGFQLATAAGGATVLFPTNRAQRLIEDGRDESLFKLLVAAEETLERPPDAATGRLMPSLRDRRDVELDEVVWRTLADGAAALDSAPELPVIVCGVDGESTFGMIRREALGREPDEAMAAALANLAAEEVELERFELGDLPIVAVTGSFYAAEKLLDVAFLRGLHARLGAELLAAAVPSRGLLLVAPAPEDTSRLARFAALAQARHGDSGGRAISPVVLLVSAGEVIGFVRAPGDEPRPDTSTLRADTSPETPRRAGLLRRLLGRK